jgi:MFS family permease
LAALNGAVVILLAGWYSDRTGDRLRYAAVLGGIAGIGLLLIGLAPRRAQS